MLIIEWLKRNTAKKNENGEIRLSDKEKEAYLSLTENLDKQERQERIQVLLAEYDACHSCRNHFDSVRWTIGSIFLAVLFALFGISFQKEIADNIIAVILITSFSAFILLTWFSYDRLIQPYIDSCYRRLWEIEEIFQKQKFNISLHNAMKRKYPKGRGRKIFNYTTGVLFVFWIIRILVLVKTVGLF